MLDTKTKVLALRYVRQARKHEADYAEYCEEMAEQGYRPEHCIHGTYLWTDYDPICGYCEDGEDNIYADAIARAKREVEHANEVRRVHAEVIIAVADLNLRPDQLARISEVILEAL